jgi:hypothetical protein
MSLVFLHLISATVYAEYFPVPTDLLYRAVSKTCRPRILNTIVSAVVVGMVDDVVVSVTCSADWTAVMNAVTTAAGRVLSDVVLVGGGHPWTEKFAYNEHAKEASAASVVRAGAGGLESVLVTVTVAFG